MSGVMKPASSIHSIMWYYVLSLLLNSVTPFDQDFLDCATRMIVVAEPNDFERKSLDSPNLQIKISSDLTSNGTFEHETTDDDLLHPLKFIHLRFRKHCSVILVDTSLANMISETVAQLVESKLTLLHRDIFIFYCDSAQLSEIVHSIPFEQIAFKYIAATGWESSVATAAAACSSFKRQGSVVIYNCATTVNRRQVKTAILVAPQFYRIRKNPDGTVVRVGGVFHHILEECSARLNFSVDFVQVFSSGAKWANGSWTGAVGHLFRGVVDVAIPMGLEVSRNHIISAPSTFTSYRKVFWVKASANRLVAVTAVVKPLTLQVWLGIGLVIVATIPIMLYFVRHDFHGSFASASYKLTDVMIRLLLEQSTALRGWDGGRTRAMIIVGAVFSTIIGTSYRSKLYDFLTFSEDDPVPLTFHQLAFSRYKLYFRTYGGVGYKAMIESKDPVHKAMLSDNRLQLVYSTVGCIQKVFTDEKAACIDYDFSGGYTLAANATLYFGTEGTGVELFKRSNDWDASFMVTWAFRKYSPLVGLFDKVIRWILAAGLYDAWRRMDWGGQKMQGIRFLKTQKNSTLKKILEEFHNRLSAEPTGLPLTTLLIPFIIVIAASSVGLIALFAEIILNRRQTNRRMRALAAINAAQFAVRVQERMG